MAKSACETINVNENENETALSISNVSVAYNKIDVVKNVSLNIDYGTTVGLVGLNGTGKTTLIKAVLGLRNVSAGTIHVDGFNAAINKHKINLAYLPERFDPPGFLTGEEFLIFSLKVYGRKYNREVMHEAIEMLAMDRKFLKKRVNTYSKGMRQKLGLVATLFCGCSLVILDEPMSGLDPLARSLVKNLMIKAKNEGKTILMSSHILSDIGEICDRVAVMHKGEIVFDGTPEKMSEKGNNANLEKAFLQIIETKGESQ